ncbi:MAG: outer membrane protein assembly factor BamA, partial [Pseudomonadota bacterium]
MILRTVFAVALSVFVAGGAQAQQGGTISAIVVEGAQRIDDATVQSYMAVAPGEPFDLALINESLKSLYATGLFADVRIERQGGALIVRVEENPIISQIAFEGNNRIDDETLESEIQLRSRVVYTPARAQADTQRIQELYRRSGRFAARIEPKLIERDQNRVDLVFEIDEGDTTGIRSILFVGNEAFSDGELRDVIGTTESAWWAFFRVSDTYDPDRLSFDRELLRRFYLSEGYADFEIRSAVAELTPDEADFIITFTVDEGVRYRFDDAIVTAQIRGLPVGQFAPLITHERGEFYDASEVETTVEALSDAVGDLGYAFVDIRPQIERNREARTIELNYAIGEGPKVIVERIDVTGNFRTQDEVIRREFRFAEGDAFNTSKLRRSRQRIQNLGFFSNVDVRTTPGSSPDRTVVEVEVEERSTGEISFGLGFSTADGPLGDVAIRERNFLGKGQDLRLAVQVAGDSQQVDFGFTEPYFLDRPLLAGVNVRATQRDLQDETSFDERNVGGGFVIGYEIAENLRQRWTYDFSRR